MGLLKLVGVCVEDSCMYLLYFGTVLYHASQLYVLNIAYTDLLGPKSRNLSDVLIIFYIKFLIFFAKTYFANSVRNVKFAFLYFIKHVTIPSNKVTTLIFRGNLRGKPHSG
jgi:hypothetical protein